MNGWPVFGARLRTQAPSSTHKRHKHCIAHCHSMALANMSILKEANNWANILEDGCLCSRGYSALEAPPARAFETHRRIKVLVLIGGVVAVVGVYVYLKAAAECVRPWDQCYDN